MTKEKFIAIMMLYGMPKDEAEKLSKCFIFESRPKVEVVDGEEVELDELSYEVGYTRGQMADRPKGKWIIERGYEEVIVTCSNCGAKDYIPTTIDGRFYFNRNYCWDCGADIRGEE